VDLWIARTSIITYDPDIEVQERAITLLKLLKFLKADLARRGSSTGYSTHLLDEPGFPKSLQLIHPLFSAYELNAVATAAQDSVSLPPGLDLDFEIVPRDVAFADQGRKENKSKKKRPKVQDEVLIQSVTRSTYESANDPYYLRDDSQRSKRYDSAPDIDSIPIVHLGDLSLPSERYIVIPTAVVEREGEMPPANNAAADDNVEESPVISLQPVQVLRNKKKNSKGKQGATT